MLRKIHKILGLALGGYMLLMAATGTILAFESAVFRIAFDLQQPAPVMSASQAAAFGGSLENVRAVLTPSAEVPAVKVYFTNAAPRLYNAETLAEIRDPLGLQTLFHTVFDLHTELLLGETGETIIGFLALAALGLVITAPFLGYRWRRSVVAQSVPASVQQRRKHLRIGLVVLPVLAISLVTGLGMTFHTQAKSWLPVILPQLPARAAGAAIVTEAPLRLVVFREGKPAYVRFKQPGEWHPNGRSKADYDGRGGFENVEDALAAPLGMRVYNSLYPLHSGRMDGQLMRIMVAVSGAGIVSLAYLGLASAVGRWTAKGKAVASQRAHQNG
ncbi:MAG: PepSY-associated TM helix domain-containing protein [Pseudomonadota bacterium]